MLRRSTSIVTALLLVGFVSPPTYSQVAHAQTPDPVVTFLVGLPRDSNDLQEAAVARSTPDSVLFRDHLSVREAGEAYGAEPRAIARLRQAARPFGIKVAVGEDRLLARLSASRSQWERIYGLPMSVSEPTQGYPYRTFVMRDGDGYAEPPKALRDVTEEWVPLAFEYLASADTAGISPTTFDFLQGVLVSPGSPQTWPRNEGTVPAEACDAAAIRDGTVYAPQQIHDAYGVTRLASSGVRGEGAKLTVVSFGGGYAASDLAQAARCFDYSATRIDVRTGTGVARPFINAYVETHLNLITASAALPDAMAITLLEVTYSPIGITDAFARMLEGPTPPDAVSLSYGICEADYRAQAGEYISLNEDLLRMAAIVGTSVVAATGDFGSSMCQSDTSKPTVWYPASSPWVTAVGGTRLTLRPDNSRQWESVWNDAPYAAGLMPGAAGGGGPSALFDRPWWQRGATLRGTRTVPDVSLLGAIRPGWPVVYGGEVFTSGGTAGGAPLVAAQFAAISAKERSQGLPTIGFANPWLYAASGMRRLPYFDVRTGNNAVMPVGCCSAYKGYDLASGLGVPTFDRIYAALPRANRPLAKSKSHDAR